VYYLVQLHDRPDAPADSNADHDPYIDDLIARNRVLLGGPFEDAPPPGVFAAYVLRCDSMDDARAIVATDPLVTSGQVSATIHGWRLVGVNTDAIDDGLIILPSDIAS
jgi:uncharacterized protein YciI